MLDLTPETEALVRRFAQSRNQTIDEALRAAILRETRTQGRPSDRGTAPETIAARRAAFDRLARQIASLPDLDPRTSDEIMDDLNAL